MIMNSTPSTFDSETCDNSDQYVVEVFFDGDCPLCQREIRLLQKLDRRHRIRFTDIASSDFDAGTIGISQQRLMDEIHGRLPDGSWITGVEVFRRLYGAVGFKWIVPATRIPGISHALDAGYRIFAKNRLKWTGRCSGPGASCALETTSTNDSNSDAEPSSSSLAAEWSWREPSPHRRKNRFAATKGNSVGDLDCESAIVGNLKREFSCE